VLLASKSTINFTGLHIRHVRTKEGETTWELIHKTGKSTDRDETLITAKTIEEIGAWLMINSLYTDDPGVNLIPNPTPVTANDIRKLFKSLGAYFDPLIHQPVGFDPLLNKEALAGLFVSVNFYSPQQQRDITDYTLIYMNTWGEMFLKSFWPEKGLPDVKELKKAVQGHLHPLSFPERSLCYFRGITKKF